MAIARVAAGVLLPKSVLQELQSTFGRQNAHCKSCNARFGRKMPSARVATDVLEEKCRLQELQNVFGYQNARCNSCNCHFGSKTPIVAPEIRVFFADKVPNISCLGGFVGALTVSGSFATFVA